MYIYDKHAPKIAAGLRTSAREQLEITDLNRAYLDRGQLNVEKMRRGFVWLDTATPDSLMEAAEFVRTLEKRQGFQIACPEEIAFNLGWISSTELQRQSEALSKSEYGKFLGRLSLAHELWLRNRGAPDAMKRAHTERDWILARIAEEPDITLQALLVDLHNLQ